MSRGTRQRAPIQGAAEETPILRQYREAKAAHPDGILLFRLGDFFEVFFDDALEAAPVMGVTLTSRPMGRTGRAPMCGVPAHAWPPYVGRLLRSGRKVVICDQVESPQGTRGIARREITRVLTPGTVLEEAYLEPGATNFLVACWRHGQLAGLAACDVSAGELLLCQLPGDRLEEEIERLHPSEVLSPPDTEEYRFDPERGKQRLRDVLGIGYLAGIGAESAELAVGAAGVVLEYLQSNQVRLSPGLLRVRTYSAEATMHLDLATRRNLEVEALIKLVDHTSTAAGLRRLRSWLEAPLRDLETIELRQEAVGEVAGDVRHDEDLASCLRQVGDLERMTSRAAQGLASPRELGSLQRALRALPDVKALAEDGRALALRALGARIEPQPELAEELERALVDDPPANPREGGFVRAGYDDQLDQIRTASSTSRQWINALEAAERERTGVRSLKVGYNRVFGYYIEISHANSAAIPGDYIRKQTLVGAERYITPELKEHETIVLSSQHDAVRREQEILRSLQERIVERAGDILRAAEAAAELDALRSLGAAARSERWVRPTMTLNPELEVTGGRHPVVEAALSPGSFVANDVALDTRRAQLVVLTGPNMAGKSTYLRQVALLLLLAQSGSFVPADSARVGLADRIFTRVGAHDDLASGMSTFMVEMTETANILNHATPASLVILDEVGRGTSTYDGMSIAQAVVEYLHDSPRLGCRTLFATHYHELTALADHLPRVVNQRMEVLEEGDRVQFLHRVVPGGADRSYGIHVAALAGLPNQVVARARQLLDELERQRPLEPPDRQLALNLSLEDPLRHELQAIELDRLSPLEALQTLYELRRKSVRD